MISYYEILPALKEVLHVWNLQKCPLCVCRITIPCTYIGNLRYGKYNNVSSSNFFFTQVLGEGALFSLDRMGDHFVTPFLMIKKFMTPLWTYNDEEIYTTLPHPIRIARKICILGVISFKKISKSCGRPIISWLFLWPLIFHKNIFCDPSPPPPFQRKW